MSDDEFSYDDDEYLDFDDFPFNEAEDLATHTVQSPVFVNYDPSWETASYASDWEEYYSDEYWDQGKPKKREPKRDSITGAESTIGTENLKTKRRKGKSNGIPSLSLGEPSLAGSTVVWKPKKETLESCDGTIVNDGHGESVSLLPDWRERFKLPTTNGPKARQRKGKQKAVAVEVGDSSPEEYHDNVLPAPPTMLEEHKGLPSRGRAIPAALREPALESNGTAAFPSSDEGSDLDEHVSKSNAVVRSSGNRRVLAVEVSSQYAMIAPRPKGNLGRPQEEKLHDLMIGNGNEGDRGAHVEIATINRKRKVDDESSSSDNTTEVPNRNTKRGRPKKQRTSTCSEQNHLELSAETAPPSGKRKRGRPKKLTPSPLSKEVTKIDVRTRAAPIGKTKGVNITRNGLIQPVPVNGLAPTREKRKMSDSEDELSMPPPKRQNDLKDAKAPAVAGTKEPLARRSMRKK